MAKLVGQEHISALGENKRLKHQRGRLWDSHEVADDLRVVEVDQPPNSDLAAK